MQLHLKKLYTCNSRAGEVGTGGPLGFLASQLSQIGQLGIQRETMSQKLRQKATEEGRHRMLTSGYHTYMHAHPHKNKKKCPVMF